MWHKIRIIIEILRGRYSFIALYVRPITDEHAELVAVHKLGGMQDSAVVFPYITIALQNSEQDVFYNEILDKIRN